MLWALALIKPIVQIPYVGPVLALMGPKAMKEIISSVVIVLLLYGAHVKSKNVR